MSVRVEVSVRVTNLEGDYTFMEEERETIVHHDGANVSKFGNPSLLIDMLADVQDSITRRAMELAMDDLRQSRARRGPRVMSPKFRNLSFPARNARTVGVCDALNHATRTLHDLQAFRRSCLIRHAVTGHPRWLEHAREAEKRTVAVRLTVATRKLALALLVVAGRRSRPSSGLVLTIADTSPRAHRVARRPRRWQTVHRADETDDALVVAA